MNFEQFLAGLPTEQQTLVKNTLAQMVNDRIDEQVTAGTLIRPEAQEQQLDMSAMSPEMRTQWQTMQADLKAQTELLAKMQREKAFAAFKSSLDVGNLAIKDEHFEALFEIKSACAEQFDVLSEVFKAANTAMSGAFTASGSPVSITGEGNELDYVDMIEKTMKDNEGMDYEAAAKFVTAKYPYLYDAYRDSLY